MAAEDLHDTVRLRRQSQTALPAEDLVATLLAELNGISGHDNHEADAAPLSNSADPGANQGSRHRRRRRGKPVENQTDTVRLHLRRNTMLPEEDVVDFLLTEPAAWDPGARFFNGDDDDYAKENDDRETARIIPDVRRGSVFTLPPAGDESAPVSQTKASDAAIGDAARDLIEKLRNGRI